MYSEISSLKTTGLTVNRTGWFRRSFDLSDGKSTYGQLSYPGFFRRKASVKTASASWNFQRKNFFSRKVLITDANGLPVAELSLGWFRYNALLQFSNGTAYKFSRLSFWGRKFVWKDEQEKQLMILKGRFFSKILLEVTLEKDTQPDDRLLLLAFLSAYIYLTIRRKKAAAAH